MSARCRLSSSHRLWGHYYPQSLSLQDEEPCPTRSYDSLTLLFLYMHFPLLSQGVTSPTNISSSLVCHFNLSLRPQFLRSLVLVFFPSPPLWSFGFFSFFLWFFLQKHQTGSLLLPNEVLEREKKERSPLKSYVLSSFLWTTSFSIFNCYSLEWGPVLSCAF